METPKEYYYTYYSYEEWGRGYFGSRRCYCLPEEDMKYLGSFKDKTFKPTQKIILKDDYATREEAYADEIILQQHYKVVENPHFANMSYQTSTKFYYVPPTEQAIENGKKAGQKTYELGVGVHSLTKEQQIENSKKGGQKAYELGLGFHALSKEERIETGKKSGQKLKELGIGIHSLTKEQKSENGKKGGKKSGQKAYKLGIGIHALSKEERIKNGKKGNETNKRNKTSIYGLTTEQMSETAKRNNTQKWMCLETGYVSNSGGLSRYQKAKGIDTSKRKRIE